MAGYFETLLFTDAHDENINSHSNENNNNHEKNSHINNNNNNNNNKSYQGDINNQHNIGLLTSHDRVMLSIRPSTHTTNMYR